jgi:filamentous hemagglutinin family protein
MLQTGTRGLIWAIAQSGVVVFALAIGLAEGAIGQIVSDDTLGAERSQVSAAGDRIEGGAQRGQNLFHSFREFNVGTGQQVYFANPATVRNIFSRVTGTNVSNIDGVLGVDGSANLFLMNPNGILFGQNARLDVGGSFVGTTANAIGFGDRGWFSATSPEAASSLLTVSPSVFLFNQVPHGSIINSSVAPAGFDPLIDSNVVGLQVPERQSLILLGGDVNVVNGAGLIAFGGRVELGGVVGRGTVALNTNPNLLSLVFRDNTVRANISLTNQATINVDGEGSGSVQIQAARLLMSDLSQIFSNTTGSKDGGNIFVQAHNAIIIDNSSINTDFVLPNLSISQPVTGRSGAITIRTNQLTITSNSIDDPTISLGVIGTHTVGAGNSGHLTVEAEKIRLTNGGQLVADTSGTGRSGNLTVHASDSIEVSGLLGKFRSLLSSETVSQDSNGGRAGNLAITTGRLVVRDGGAVSVETRGTGNGGNARIHADQVIVQNGGQVQAGTRGTGRGGNLIINASDSIDVIGSNGHGSPSGLFTPTYGFGEGGNLTIVTGRLRVLEGGIISASSLAIRSGRGGNLFLNASDSIEVSGTSVDRFHSSIVAETGRMLNTINPHASSARGGNLTIRTRQLNIQNRGEVSTSTFGRGQGGNINLRRISDLNIINSSTLSTQSQGSGRAGELNIMANSIVLDHSNITAETRSTDKQGGANVRIQNLDRLLYLQNGGQISARAFNNANGGNVTIDANNGFVVARVGANQNNDIIANAREGNGGNIDTTTQGIFGIQERDQSSLTNDIDASSQFGLNGNIEINQLNVDPSRGLIELPTTPIDATRQIASVCPTNTQQADRLGSFINSGRGGLPPNPTDLLSTDNLLSEWVTPGESGNANVKAASPPETQAIVEAQGLGYDSQGKVILVAPAPVVTPTHCP